MEMVVDIIKTDLDHVLRTYVLEPSYARARFIKHNSKHRFYSSTEDYSSKEGKAVSIAQLGIFISTQAMFLKRQAPLLKELTVNIFMQF